VKRIVAVSALIVATCLLAPSSAGAIIQLDRGIAGARLGNTKAEVKTALGQPNRIRNGMNDFGPFTVFIYRGGIRVTFQSGNAVTAATTVGLGDRTRRGVGVRSTQAAVENRVPGVTCEAFGQTTLCTRGELEPGEIVNTFFIRNGRVFRVTVGRVID
jgi:hypothetical protein